MVSWHFFFVIFSFQKQSVFFARWKNADKLLSTNKQLNLIQCFYVQSKCWLNSQNLNAIISCTHDRSAELCRPLKLLLCKKCRYEIYSSKWPTSMPHISIILKCNSAFQLMSMSTIDYWLSSCDFAVKWIETMKWNGHLFEMLHNFRMHLKIVCTNNLDKINL